MPTYKSSDYKLSAVKYYLSDSKNQVQTCKIFGCFERSINIFLRFLYQVEEDNNNFYEEDTNKFYEEYAQDTRELQNKGFY